MAGAIALAAVIVVLVPRWKAPQNSQARLAYDQGRSHLYRFQYEAAESLFEEALTAEPAFAMAALATAMTRQRMGAAEAADSAFALADSLAATGADACERLWIRYRVAEFRKDRSSQKSALKQLQAEFPDNAFTLELEAERARNAGDIDRAVELFEAVLAARPERVDLLNRLGYLELERGESEEAISHLRRYAFYAADAANPHDSLGEFLLATGQYFESAQEYLTAIEIDPAFSSSILGASNALMITGQLRRAENLLRTAHDQLAIDERLPRYHLSQTQILFAREQWSQLQAEVDRRLQLPEFGAGGAVGPALWMRALQCVASTRQGDFALARGQRDSLIAQSAALRAALPEYASQWRQVLELLESSVRATFAVRFDDRPIQRLAQLRTDVEAATLPAYQLLAFRGLLSEALRSHGLYEEALEVAETILEAHPGQPRSNLLAARCLVELGQPEEALARIGVGLSTLRYADSDLPLLEELRRLRDRLEPPSS